MKNLKLQLKIQKLIFKIQSLVFLIIILSVNLFVTGPVFAGCIDECAGLQGQAYQECLSSCGETGSGSGAVEPEALEIVLEEVAQDQGLGNVGGFNLTTLGGILGRFTKFIFPLSGLALLFYLIWGGFSYLTSAGDPKKTEAAKDKLTKGLLGFIIIISAYWIVQITAFIFGIEGDVSGLFG